MKLEFDQVLFFSNFKCPVFLLVHWKGVAEVIEDAEDFIQFEDLYNLLFAVERFTYLRDFSNYFCLIDFFYLNLRDFVN